MKIATKRVFVNYEPNPTLFRSSNHIVVSWLFEIKTHVVIYVLAFNELTKQKPVRPYDLFHCGAP